ncbi:MAG TPA: acetylxylan esterase [Gaiellaceae bacterium]|nr:acetylxylan esterase [Gaiellaceae bacterium]
MGTIGKALLRQIYRCAGLLLLVALVAACGGEKSDVPSQFSYDDSQPLDVQDKPTSFSTNEVRVDDISFTGPGSTRLNAYLLMPSASSGRHPAVIYAHGAGGDRQELLDEALKMSEQGAVTLTLDMIYSPSRARPLPQGMAGARANSKLEQQAVKEVRRAVDLLQSRDDVDDDAIGYVGWSQGARMGAVISGVEHRIKAFDLIAGGAAPVSEYVKYAPVDLQDELRTLLQKTDPIHFVGLAKPSELLFQDGRQDEIVPEAALRKLAGAGSEPKEVRWYESGHVPSATMWADSRNWLAERLEID